MSVSPPLISSRALLVTVVIAALFACAYAALPYAMSYFSKTASAFEDDIKAFEESDAASPPELGKVLFIGSSSIRMWETLEEDMAPIGVINRGFGGSMLHHSTHFFDRIVLPYQPSVVVMYAGGNDISNLIAPRSAETVVADFEEFADKLHSNLGPVPFLYIAIKPSVLREEFWPEMQKANRAIEIIAQENPLLHYIDGATPLLGADGKPTQDYLLWDGLHLNKKGYAIWTEIVRPKLLALQ